MWPAILAFINSHSTSIGLGAGYVLIAAINHLPAPGTHVTKYQYFYDLTRSLMNSPTIQRFAPPQPIPNEVPKGVTK